MINEKKTFILFGYTSDTLSYGSNKKVWRICIVCGKEEDVRYNSYVNGCKKCRKCSHIGLKHTDATKLKMSITSIGKICTIETKLKMSASSPRISGEAHHMFGKHHTVESKRKNSLSHTGEKNHKWRGGKKLRVARKNTKRRELFGFIYHNMPQPNFEGHHVDFNHVIFIPKYLHKSVRHSVVHDTNMDIINDLTCDWYLNYQIISDKSF